MLTMVLVMVGKSSLIGFLGRRCHQYFCKVSGTVLGMTCVAGIAASKSTPLLCAVFYKMPGTRQEKEPSLPGAILLENEPGSL
jgi:hypothetical protein